VLPPLPPIQHRDEGAENETRPAAAP